MKVAFVILDNEVIALFPEEPCTRSPREILSYMHVGQHSAASEHLLFECRPATESEYESLLKEVRDVYYLENITVLNVKRLQELGPVSAYYMEIRRKFFHNYAVAWRLGGGK